MAGFGSNFLEILLIPALHCSHTFKPYW